MDPDDDDQVSAEGGPEDGGGSAAEAEEVALPVMRRPAAPGCRLPLIASRPSEYRFQSLSDFTRSKKQKGQLPETKKTLAPAAG